MYQESRILINPNSVVLAITKYFLQFVMAVLAIGELRFLSPIIVQPSLFEIKAPLYILNYALTSTSEPDVAV